MTAAVEVCIIAARTPLEVETVRTLVREYAAWLALDTVSAGLDSELARLPHPFVPPSGGMWIAIAEGRPLGCVALRPLGEVRACELKRLYVRPEARGLRVGQALLAAALRHAEAAGCRELLLDTLPRMEAAIALYHANGFRPVPPYWDSPLPGTLYFGKTLAG